MKPTATKSEFGKPKVNPDYTLTRPKRLRKFEKVDGVKVVKDGWVDLDKRKFDGITIPQTSKGQGRGVAGGVVNLRG